MNKFSQFSRFKLNTAQCFFTASQMKYTINDFNENFSDEHPFSHCVGKFKFFVDMLADVTNPNNNEVESYCTMLNVLAPDYDDCDLSDVENDYAEFINTVIETLLDIVDEQHLTNTDEIIDCIQNLNFNGINLNFQEQQFILDCYYSTLDDYKLMFMKDGICHCETDYLNTRENIAVDDYKKNMTEPCDCIILERMFDFDKGYFGYEFYEFLVQQSREYKFDFVLDFSGIKTIKEWIEYTILTLVDLNGDLTTCDDMEDTIAENNEAIEWLKSFLF